MLFGMCRQVSSSKRFTPHITSPTRSHSTETKGPSRVSREAPSAHTVYSMGRKYAMVNFYSHGIPGWVPTGSMGILRFATSFKADGELVINILELQPTATPPLPVVKSFPVLPCDGRFSFSSVSFHASFVSWEEVIILDVRDSKILLQTRVHLYDLSGEPRGHFSPDGSLFTCATSLYDIRIWKKTPTGYAPWRSLTPRSGISRFSFSPTAVLFLTWSREGIQLLLPDNFVNPSPPNMVELNCRRAEHLVAYSVDGSRIATVRQDDSVVTVLDALSGSPQQSIKIGRAHV